MTISGILRLLRRRSADAPLPVSAARIPTLKNRQPIAGPGPISFAPRPGVAPLPLDLPLDWDQNPYSDRNWCAQLNMVRCADSHIAAYDQGGDPRYLHWLAALLCDWHRFHVTLGRKSRYGWGDMVIGQRATRLAYLLGADRVRAGILTHSQRRTLRHSAKAHAHRIMVVNPVRMSNHVFDDLIGLRALQQVLPARPWSAQIDAFVAQHLPPLIAMQFGSGGVHRENSPGYQRYANSKLRHFLSSGWFAGFGLEDLLAEAEATNRWFCMPDGATVPVGDTDGTPALPMRPRTPAETGLHRSGGYLVRRDRTTRGQVPPASYFLFMGCAQAPFHKHNDDLSYHWFDHTPLVTDTGKYAYLNNEQRDYAISARAHNTVEIDGRDPLPATLSELTEYPFAGDLLRHVEDTRLGTLASGRSVYHRLGAIHTRTLLFRPGRFVLVADLIEDLPDVSGGPRPVTQWTHFAPAIAMQRRGPLTFAGHTPDDRRVEIRLAPGAAGVPGAQATADLVRGQTEPRRQGWVSDGYAQLAPRDAVGLSMPHAGRTWLASLVSLGETARRLEWNRNGLLRAEFADEVVVLQPDDGETPPAARRRAPAQP